MPRALRRQVPGQERPVCVRWFSDADPRDRRQENEFGYDGALLARRRKCDQVKCPVDCQQSRGSSWSKCTKDCEGGSCSRTRSVSAGIGVAQFGNGEILDDGTVSDARLIQPLSSDMGTVKKAVDGLSTRRASPTWPRLSIWRRRCSSAAGRGP